MSLLNTDNSTFYGDTDSTSGSWYMPSYLMQKKEYVSSVAAIAPRMLQKTKELPEEKSLKRAMLTCQQERKRQEEEARLQELQCKEAERLAKRVEQADARGKVEKAEKMEVNRCFCTKNLWS